MYRKGGLNTKMYCRKCGKQINDQNKFCNYCGTPVISTGGIGNLDSGRMTANDQIDLTSTQKKSKKPVIVGCCIGIIVLLVLTIVFFAGKLFFQQNESTLKDEKAVESHYENEILSDEEPKEDARQQTEEVLEDGAATEDLEDISVSDLSLQEYSAITENMRNNFIF